MLNLLVKTLCPGWSGGEDVVLVSLTTWECYGSEEIESVI